MPGAIETISAVTLITRDMPRALAFYRNLGFGVARGDEDDDFVTLRAGDRFLNLSREGHPGTRWGRLIFHVSDVDAFYEHICQRELAPEFPPRDAPWGERYFHILDPDGHELSFARPLSTRGSNARA